MNTAEGGAGSAVDAAVVDAVAAEPAMKSFVIVTQIYPNSNESLTLNFEIHFENNEFFIIISDNHTGAKNKFTLSKDLKFDSKVLNGESDFYPEKIKTKFKEIKKQILVKIKEKIKDFKKSLNDKINKIIEETRNSIRDLLKLDTGETAPEPAPPPDLSPAADAAATGVAERLLNEPDSNRAQRSLFSKQSKRTEGRGPGGLHGGKRRRRTGQKKKTNQKKRTRQKR